MPATILDTIRERLQSADVAFRELHHEPTYTSEESARVRGEPLRNGGKALLMKVGSDYRLFVLCADDKIDSGAVREHFGVRKMRFATREELLAQTGLVPGSVPPFGHPVLPFELYVEAGVTQNERIAFNAGSLCDSIIMSREDYLRIAQPRDVFSFAATGE